MLLIIASIIFGRLNKIRVKSKMSRNDKKGHGGKHTRPKKWSGARRPAGPATTALHNSIDFSDNRRFNIKIYIKRRYVFWSQHRAQRHNCNSGPWTPPQSLLVLSDRNHIMSNASIVKGFQLSHYQREVIIF